MHKWVSYRPAMNITLNKINISWVRYHYSCDRVTIVSLLWHHPQMDCDFISKLKTEQVRNGEDVQRLSFLSSTVDSLCHVGNKIKHVLLWRTVLALTRVLFLCLFPSLLHNLGNKHKNNPLVSTETVRHLSTYIILFVMMQVGSQTWLTAYSQYKQSPFDKI